MEKNVCLICGEELIYTPAEEPMRCSVCGKTFTSNAKCKNGHFVCDSCHSKEGLIDIQRICLTSDSKNPIDIALQIMSHPSMHMHGPEHHIMVGAALLTAYKNCGLLDSKIDFERALTEAVTRGSKVPGGTCGFWGTCGAAMSMGIFLSIITMSTPLSKDSWAQIQKGVSSALGKISNYGGPRCCKRSAFLSMLAAMDFLKTEFGIELEGSGQDIICDFSSQNRECLGKDCPFHKSHK